MKKTVAFCKCLMVVIRKIFFNSSKIDKSHICEEFGKIDFDGATSVEKEHIEEYAYNYSTTTRWQTL